MENNQSITDNFLWRFFERVGIEVVSFFVAIILARLLSPSEYGTLAIVSAIISFLQVFVDGGMGNSLIQKKDADELDFSSVFIFNMIICVILYAILFAFAPYIAEFYDDEALTGVLRALGIVIIVSGVKNIQQAYVARNMLFKRFFFSSLGGTIIAAIVSIVMAYGGYGIWALVAQQLVDTIVDTCVLWFTIDWKPQLKFSMDRLKRLFSYGWKLLATGLLGALYNNINQLCIGRVYDSESLAYYNRGKSWPNLLVSNINTSIDSILLPAFSKNQDDKTKLREQCKKSIDMSCYVVFPAMMGLAMVAEPLVKIVLTDKWLPSVWYLRIFCLSFATYPIQTANINVIKAVGKSGTYLKCELVKRAFQLVLLIIGLTISTKAVCLSFLITNLLACLVFSWPNREIIGYSTLEQLVDLLRIVFATILMGIAVYIIGKIPLSEYMILLLQVIGGCVCYILFSITLKIKEYLTIKNMLFSRFKS